MIKEKQLNNDMEKISVNRNLSVEETKEALLELAKANEIPIKLSTDTVKTGGIFNSKEYDCLVIAHPDHENDYYKIIILYGYGEIIVVSTGTSKQMKKFNVAEANKQMRRGKSMSYKVGNIIVGALWTIGKSKEKLNQENAYYDTILGMLGICFEVEE